MFNVFLRDGSIFNVLIKQQDAERQANGRPAMTKFQLLEKYPNGKQKTRWGFLRSTAIVEYVGFRDPLAGLRFNTSYIISADVVLDASDFWNLGGVLSSEVKALGRRKALVKALDAAGFNREDKKEFITEFEIFEHDRRAANLLPQIEAEVSRLLDVYTSAGGATKLFAERIARGEV